MRIHTNHGEMDLEIDPTTNRARSVRATRPAAPVPGERPAGPRYRSQLEARYAQHLEKRREAGEIRQWRHEAIRVTLAQRTTLTPDFWVELPDRSIEIHEVKGPYVTEDSWLKLKIAAEHWPWFRWFKIQWKEGAWDAASLPRRW